LVINPYFDAIEPTMMDQYRLPLPDHQESYGSGSQSEKASQGGEEAKERSTGYVDIIALVRSLQRTAGMTDCFRMGNVDCDVIDCDWRSYCLGKPAVPPKK
jgi:hypothetical protein